MDQAVGGHAGMGWVLRGAGENRDVIPSVARNLTVSHWRCRTRFFTLFRMT